MAQLKYLGPLLLLLYGCDVFDHYREGNLDASELKALLDSGKFHPDATYRRDTLLILASRDGRSDMVHVLLEANADVNKKGHRGRTALSMAAREGHSIVVQMLLGAGSHMDTRDTGGRSALDQAVISNNDAIVQLMLNEGIDRDTRRRALLWAVRTGNESIMNAFLDRGLDGDEKNAALLLAAFIGDAPAVDTLLLNGADIDTRNREGNTPLILAYGNGHGGVVDMLFQRGATVPEGLEDASTWIKEWDPSDQQGVGHIVIECSCYERDSAWHDFIGLARGKGRNIDEARENAKYNCPRAEYSMDFWSGNDGTLLERCYAVTDEINRLMQ